VPSRRAELSARRRSGGSSPRVPPSGGARFALPRRGRSATRRRPTADRRAP